MDASRLILGTTTKTMLLSLPITNVTPRQRTVRLTAAYKPAKTIRISLNTDSSLPGKAIVGRPIRLNARSSRVSLTRITVTRRSTVRSEGLIRHRNEASATGFVSTRKQNTGKSITAFIFNQRDWRAKNAFIGPLELKFSTSVVLDSTTRFP